MSGHSKWATIKRQKGANDARRGQLFTKLSMAVTLAVREGGGVSDPSGNFKLRLAIDAARAANMPKENIDRAIARASGKGEAALEEAVYEGFGPGGVSFIVESATDNKQRTVSEVKSTLDKNGGTLGVQGAVSYQFEQKGMIVVPKPSDMDQLFIQAIDSGAEDVEEGGEEVIIYTKPEDLNMVRENLLAFQLPILSAEFTRKPTTMITIDDREKAEKIIGLIDKLESLGDVQKVYTNADIPDELL